jgi:hypothetical protein
VVRRMDSRGKKKVKNIKGVEVKKTMEKMKKILIGKLNGLFKRLINLMKRKVEFFN